MSFLKKTAKNVCVLIILASCGSLEQEPAAITNKISKIGQNNFLNRFFACISCNIAVTPKFVFRSNSRIFSSNTFEMTKRLVLGGRGSR